MTKRKYRPGSGDQLAEEARRWDSRKLDPKTWDEAPEAVPRAQASTAISLRMPTQMIEILKAFAEREGVGYQVLMKRWLDDRIRREREELTGRQLVKLHGARIYSIAAGFSSEDAQVLHVTEAV
jgi:predicted DNA binding CopG/RHH family protein